MLKKLILTSFAAMTLVPAVEAGTIVWAAGQNNGFSLVSGAELPAGNYVRLGVFDIPDSQIVSNSQNISFLDQHFLPIGSARIGDGLAGANSNFTATTQVDTSAVAGAQIYLWVFASGNLTSLSTAITTANQIGIFYMDKAVDTDWAFPVQNPVAGATSVDISDLTDVAGNALASNGVHMVVGTFPNGTSTIGSAPNFGLAIVPEPSSLVLLSLGLAALASRRRRA